APGSRTRMIWKRYFATIAVLSLSQGQSVTTVEIFKTGNKKAADSIVALIGRMGNWYDVEETSRPEDEYTAYIVSMKFHSPGGIWDEKYTRAYWTGVAQAGREIYLHNRQSLKKG